MHAMKIICTALLLYTSFLTIHGAKSFRQMEKDILDEILRHDKYDNRIRPDGSNITSAKDSPVIVRVNTYFRSISNIDTKNMKYDVQLTFRMQWNDARLNYDDRNGMIRYLNIRDTSKVWRPDLFFSNERDGHFHNILEPNELLRVYPNGNILFSIRISLTLNCPMDLKYFPFDTQTCSVYSASYGHTTEDVIFLWKEGDPIQITKNLHLPEFTLRSYFTQYCTSRTNTGEYSCLKIDLLFKRETSVHIQRFFIPTAIVTLLSFISFWINPQKWPRIVIIVIAIFALSNKVDKMTEMKPPVSYSTLIECWGSTCFIFIFAALFEYGIVYYFDKRTIKCRTDDKETNEKAEDGDAVAMKPLVEENNHVENSKEYKVNTGDGRVKNVFQRLKHSSIAMKIDIISRVLFPILFAIFVFSYFCNLPELPEDGYGSDVKKYSQM